MIIAPIASNIAENVNPIILKGNKSSHRRGKRNIANKAKGQLTVKRRNQSTIAIRVRINSIIRFRMCIAKLLPTYRTGYLG